MDKKDIVSMNFEELSSAFKEMGLPKFRATQVYDWLHKKCVASFEEMTNISKDLIAKLNDNFVIFTCAIEKKLVSSYDNTVKYYRSNEEYPYMIKDSKNNKNFSELQKNFCSCPFCISTQNS